MGSISDIELMCQMDILDNMIKVLASKGERLAKLRAEGRVSDSVYRKCLGELKKKAEDIAHDNDELFRLADANIKQMNSEGTRLKQQLEFYEVRQAIGLIPRGEFKIIQEGIDMQLADMESMQKRIKGVMDAITETSRHMGDTSGKIEESVPLPMETQISEHMPEPSSANIKSIETIICTKCQSVNRENASFCYNCGTKLIAPTNVSMEEEKV